MSSALPRHLSLSHASARRFLFHRHSHTIDFKELALGVAKLVKGSKVSPAPLRVFLCVYGQCACSCARGVLCAIVRECRRPNLIKSLTRHWWGQMEKLSLMFELTDTNGDGTLDMSEVVAMIEAENADMAEASQFTEQVSQHSRPPSPSPFWPACAAGV